MQSLSRFVGRAKPVLVTFNGRAFDLPVIALRSLSHGVPLSWYYQERGVRYRYSEEGHMDLCDWLADHGATRSGSLDAVARLGSGALGGIFRGTRHWVTLRTSESGDPFIVLRFGNEAQARRAIHALEERTGRLSHVVAPRKDAK